MASKTDNTEKPKEASNAGLDITYDWKCKNSIPRTNYFINNLNEKK